MVSRTNRARIPDQAGLPGGSRLTLAKWILTLENIAQIFAVPLMLAGFFLVLSWLDVFEMLYPWAHLIALIIFVVAFFDALGHARLRYRAPRPNRQPTAGLKWRAALRHRPLDVLTDRLAVPGDEQSVLWRAHIKRSEAQLQNLRWPRWTLSFANRDPYALRYALLIMLGIGIFGSWGVWGGRLLTAVNPALGSLTMFRPALDAWITPPEYTGMQPIMIATPAGAQNANNVIDIPEGSTLTAHLAEKGGAAPELSVNGQKIEFAIDDHRDFGVTTPITNGDTISISRGWQQLGAWHIRVVPNQPPKIALTEPVSVTERKALRLAWQATDNYGVASVTAKITPRETVPGARYYPG